MSAQYQKIQPQRRGVETYGVDADRRVERSRLLTSNAGKSRGTYTFVGASPPSGYGYGYSITGGADAVAQTLTTLGRVWTIVLSLWGLSFVIAMFNSFDPHFVPDTRATLTVFVPMWSGTLVALIYTCMGVFPLPCKRVVSKEDRLLSRAQGVYGDGHKYVDKESIPLLRRLVFWSFVIVICLIFVGVSEVHIYLTLVSVKRKHIHVRESTLWGSLSFFVVVLGLVLLYFTCWRHFNWTTCLCIALVEASIVLCIQHYVTPSTVTWLHVLVPLIVVEVIGFLQLVYVMVQSYIGRFSLTCSQVACVFGYFIVLSCAAAAELITLTLTLDPEHTHLYLCIPTDAYMCEVLPPLLCMVCVCVLVLCVSHVLRTELGHMGLTQGYGPPMTLSRTVDGWMPIGEKVSTWLLLGSVTVTSASRRRAQLLNLTAKTNATGSIQDPGLPTANPTPNPQPTPAPIMDINRQYVQPAVPISRTYSGDTNDAFADF